MTILLALANDSYSIVLGDRRLSRNGAVCEDESNKVCALFCDDARIAIAYTGVAEHRKLKTHEWLIDTLFKIGEKKHTLDEVLGELQTQSSAVFATVPAKHRLIAFLISGYRYTKTGAQHVCLLLSSFDPDAARYVAGKTLEFYRLGEPGTTIVAAAGYTSVLTDDDYSHLRMMLEANNSPPEVLYRAVEILRRVAKEPASKRLIGMQCNSAVVPRAIDTSIIGTYHSAIPVDVAPGPSVVVAVRGCTTACLGMFAATQGLILAGPNIRKNELCWCGSRKKFGACHKKKYGSVYTRIPGFQRPMSMTLQVTRKVPVLSGKRFFVFSSFA